MKILLICALSWLSSFVNADAETVDQALERLLAGGRVTAEELEAITDMDGRGPLVDGKRSCGSIYLHTVKQSIVDPVKHGGWPIRSEYVSTDKAQARTYRELKAIYEKDKSPVVAYALVCPAMFVNDFDLLPELFAKIGENKNLKAYFDKVYAAYWKPRLDPDF
jgi:hypothetical protein